MLDQKRLALYQVGLQSVGLHRPTCNDSNIQHVLCNLCVTCKIQIYMVIGIGLFLWTLKVNRRCLFKTPWSSTYMYLHCIWCRLHFTRIIYIGPTCLFISLPVHFMNLHVVMYQSQCVRNLEIVLPFNFCTRNNLILQNMQLLYQVMIIDMAVNHNLVLYLARYTDELLLIISSVILHNRAWCELGHTFYH